MTRPDHRHARPRPAGPARVGAGWIALALFAVTLALYGRTAGHGFVLVDDRTYILDNAAVREGLTPASLRWAWTSFHASNWHPLTWISHMLDVTWFGLAPGPHHLVGATLHAASAALLFVVLRRMTGATGRAAFVAAAFALHPLRVESVAWAAQRKDQLAALFWILCLAAYAAYVRRPGALRYGAVCAALAAGLLAKPVLVTLPVILLLLDRWPLARPETATRAGRTRLVLEKLPLLALCAAAASMTWAAQRSGGAVSSLDALPWTSRLANAALAYGTYLVQTVWPANLAVHYPHTATVFAGRTGLLAAGAGVAALLAGLTLLSLRKASRRTAVGVGWLWFVIALLPTIGLVQVGSQAHADRYTYLPSIGLFVALAWAGAALVSRRPGLRAPLVTAACLALAACTAATWNQLGYWRDSVSLFEHSARVAPRSLPARLNLGAALLEAGRGDEADAALRAALALDPGNPLALYHLGNLARSRGDDAAAERAYRACLGRAPDMAQAQTNLGLLLLDGNRVTAALGPLARASRLQPESIDAQVNLAHGLRLAGRAEEAESLYRRALERSPAHVAARLGLAGLLLAAGPDDEALHNLRALINEEPQLPQARLLLALELDRRGFSSEADSAWAEVLRLDPANAHALRRLGRGADAAGDD